MTYIKRKWYKKPKNSAIREEVELEDYDFENKRRSRDYIRSYIIALHYAGLYDDFHKKKVLILSSWRGDDIKFLYKLGFKSENIYIVDFEEEVCKKMCENPLFDGTHIFCMDIFDINKEKLLKKQKFDLLYLDFKFQPLRKTFEEFLPNIFNYYANDGSIFYLNLLSGREVRGDLNDIYEDIEKIFYKNIEDEIEHNKQLLEKTNKKIQKNISKFFLMGLDKNGKMKFASENNSTNNLRDVVNGIKNNKDHLSELRDKSESLCNSIDDFEEFKKNLDQTNNLHLIRKGVIEVYIKTYLNNIINNYKKFPEYLQNRRGDFSTRDWDFDNLTPKQKEVHQDIVSLIRFLTRSKYVRGLSQFIYYSKPKINGQKGNPFINTLCFLPNSEIDVQAIHQTDWNNVMIGIITFLVILYKYKQKEIREANIVDRFTKFITMEKLYDLKLNNPEFNNLFDLKDISISMDQNGNIKTSSIGVALNPDHKKKIEKVLKNIRNDARQIFFHYRRIYTTLIESGILEIKEGTKFKKGRTQNTITVLLHLIDDMMTVQPFEVVFDDSLLSIIKGNYDLSDYMFEFQKSLEICKELNSEMSESITITELKYISDYYDELEGEEKERYVAEVIEHRNKLKAVKERQKEDARLKKERKESEKLRKIEEELIEQETSKEISEVKKSIEKEQLSEDQIIINYANLSKIKKEPRPMSIIDKEEYSMAMSEEELARVCKNPTTAMKDRKKQLNKDENKERFEFAMPIINELHEQMKCLQISIIINQRYFEEHKTYSDPLYWDVNIRGIKAEMRKRGLLEIKARQDSETNDPQPEKPKIEVPKILQIDEYHFSIPILDFHDIENSKHIKDLKYAKIGDENLECEVCGERKWGKIRIHLNKRFKKAEDDRIILNIDDDFEIVCLKHHHLIHKQSDKDKIEHYYSPEEIRDFRI